MQGGGNFCQQKQCFANKMSIKSYFVWLICKVWGAVLRITILRACSLQKVIRR